MDDIGGIEDHIYRQIEEDTDTIQPSLNVIYHDYKIIQKVLVLF